jgi:hypothetical protein
VKRALLLAGLGAGLSCGTDEPRHLGTFVFHIERVAPHSDVLAGGSPAYVSARVNGEEVASTSVREGGPELRFDEPLVLDLERGDALDFYLYVADDEGRFRPRISVGWRSMSHVIAQHLLAIGDADSNAWLQFRAEKAK